MAAEGSLTARTDLDIVNTALTRLGQSPIASFGQNPGTGIILQSSYNISRDGLLRRQPWNFARNWITLAQLQAATLNLDIIPDASGPGIITFTNAYQLPNDCIRVFRFSPKDAHWRVIGRTIYSDAVPTTTTAPLLGLEPLGSDGADNQPSSSGTIGAPVSVGIEYIAQNTDPQQWDALFIEAFIWKICMEISFGVTGLVQGYQLASKEFESAMKEAAAVNGIENWADPFWNTDLTDVRYGYVGVTIQGY